MNTGQRVCDGAYIAAQQLGDSKANVGDVGQQQQCNEHAQVERQGCLDHLLHGALCNGRADEQNGANGGVSRPMPQFRTTMIPNWMGSMPMEVAMGSRMGVAIRMMGAISMIMPSTSRISR